MQNPKTVEQIKTTKGAYSLTMKIREDQTALISISDPEHEISMRLDSVDLERIALLIADHIGQYNGEDGPL